MRTRARPRCSKSVLARPCPSVCVRRPGLITEYNDEDRPVRPVDDFSVAAEGSPYIEGPRAGPLATSRGVFVEPAAGRRGLSLLVEGKVRHLDAVRDGDPRDDHATRPGELRHRVEGRVFEPLLRRVAVADDRQRRRSARRMPSIWCTSTGRAPTRSKGRFRGCAVRSSNAVREATLEENLEADQGAASRRCRGDCPFTAFRRGRPAVPC